MNLIEYIGGLIALAVPVWIFLICFGYLSYELISKWRTPILRDLEEEFIEKNEEFMFEFLFRQGAKSAFDEYGGRERRERAKKAAWREYNLLCIPVSIFVTWICTFTFGRLSC